MRFAIDVESINNCGNFCVKETRPFKTAEFRVSREIKFDLLFTRVDDNIFVDGNALCELIFSCSRCMEDFKREVQVRINFNRFFDWKNSRDIDLTDELRTEILLAVPISPICRDDCGGLCPYCGKNRGGEACACKEDKSVFSAFGNLRDIKFKKRGK